MTSVGHRLRWHASALERRVRAGRGRGLILLYHRLGEGFDPLLLDVAAERFAEHVEVIRRVAEPATLRDLLAGAGAADERPRIAVTFDDGYASVVEHALPILRRRGVPATLFVTTEPVLGGREHWWDELERRLLDPAVAADWHVELEHDPTPAHTTFRELCRSLPRLPFEARRRALDTLGERDGAEAVRHPVLGPDEVAGLAGDDLVEIGAHTVTHPVLAAFDGEAQRDEILGSRDMLEELVGRVRSFSYPHGGPGDWSRGTASLVREAGFELGCANVPGLVGRHSARFALPRLLVRDWDGDELERRLDRLL